MTIADTYRRTRDAAAAIAADVTERPQIRAAMRATVANNERLLSGCAPRSAVKPRGDAKPGEPGYREAMAAYGFATPTPLPTATAAHACLACGRHPDTHAPTGDDRCVACGLGDAREVAT